MLFRPDIAIRDIERTVYSLEFASPDPAIGADVTFHTPDVALLL